ncbi:hypothetical protein EVAR_67346_1 [Eumeta japonica]|uniref:Reverse transcriptase/retrotransposon-derived protein RNase H-like domain-containing protein n=1 Tax=Eumeta variegata TaxID=151549 RepID=A0A4C1SUA1_EUMVA|nr:hypothetical protein EVAR_67346_1 [Eumeta japonica]
MKWGNKEISQEHPKSNEMIDLTRGRSATSTSDELSGKRKEATAVSQLRDGKPLTDEAIRQANTGSTVVTRLFVDASGEALGASFMQERELTEMHPITYASRKLSDLEKKYSATERECLGVYVH